ncbi:MAG TPA: glycerate kinase [Puia sp.]|jgi:glycerate kinase|nr:glycerate kinase [Puia sp.]
MHVLIAPNAFKNALSADSAAAAIQRGLSRSRLDPTTECFPVGDGGDGTGDLLIQRLHGQRIPAKVLDPLGRPIETYFGMVSSTAIPPSPAQPPAQTAIIEMANASGLRLLDPAARNPLHTSSAGTGDLIRAALDHEARDILLGMGGSATVDGGTGILRALGARFLNSHGQPLHRLPLELTELASIDLTNLDPRLAATNIVVLCDVTNPLTGPFGAATVFGPQKGANPAAVRKLESALLHLSSVILHQTGINVADMARAGTAGGGAAGLHGLLQAKLVSGIDYFLEITSFNEALARSTHVITGEGSIDEQTLQGKAPFGVATHAKAHGLPVIALTGRLPDNRARLNPYFDEIISINPPHIRMPEALRRTAANLERTAMEWANRLAAMA